MQVVDGHIKRRGQFGLGRPSIAGHKPARPNVCSVWNDSCKIWPCTQRWLAPIKPHLQHLAAASSAGISLVANQKHITVTLATWDAVWEVYLDPKWAQQRLRLYGAQDRALEQFLNHHVCPLCAWLQLEEDMAEVSMERHGRAKQLVQTALPPKGKEYPGLGYKRLRDKPPKAQQQQQPAVAQARHGGTTSPPAPTAAAASSEAR
ncbi:hypothetical protein QJQ45_027387 [Haematococcus lacustris]|nr:hypothetical protein QJQ45_027387 [Haematococcus lacustris]